MKRFRKILLVAGLEDGPFPRRIFDLALRLARRDQAKLTLIDVVPDNELASELLPPELVELDLRERREALGRLAKVAQNEGVDIETELTVGKPFLEIIRQVLRNEHDLVLMTAEANGGGPGQLFGSTALHLLRKCPCPVWVIKPDEDDPRRRILAAVDLGADGSERQSVSRRVLEFSASVAESDGSEVRIVHCLDPWASNGSGRWLKIVPRSHRHELVALAKNDAERWLDELLAKCDLSRVPHDVRLETGPAVDVIAALCEEVDVVVMGTLSRSGPAGVLIGNTAEKVLARIDCSVLAVKPEAFTTPVRISERELVSVAAR